MTAEQEREQREIGLGQGITMWASAMALAWYNGQEPEDFGGDGTENIGFIPAWDDEGRELDEAFFPAMFDVNEGKWVAIDPQSEPFDLEQFKEMQNFDGRN